MVKTLWNVKRTKNKNFLIKAWRKSIFLCIKYKLLIFIELKIHLFFPADITKDLPYFYRIIMIAVAFKLINGKGFYMIVLSTNMIKFCNQHCNHSYDFNNTKLIDF